MHVRTLETEQTVSRPLAEVFAFFADAVHLDDLTPPWLHFRTLTPAPIVLRAGARIEYQLRVHGLPMCWQSEITVWEPPHRFVDVQQRGPYRQWIHQHRFEETPEGTRVHDRIDYAVPGGWLEPLLHRWFVGPDLRTIFAYRQQKLAAIMGPASGAEIASHPQG